jgi:hypothetical protein
MTDTWTNTDLPVLEAIVSQLDATPSEPVGLRELGKLTKLTETDLGRAMARLASASPPFFEGVEIDELTYPIFVTRIFERALQATGRWPSPETLVSGLVDALNQAADSENDPEKKSRLRQTAETLGGAALQVAIAWASASIPHP